MYLLPVTDKPCKAGFNVLLIHICLYVLYSQICTCHYNKLINKSIPFYTFYHYSVETCSEIGIKSWLPTDWCCFWCFSHSCQKFCNPFCYIEKLVRSECMGLVKHIYLIQTIILIRLLWLPGILKICVSFADKYETLSVT